MRVLHCKTNHITTPLGYMTDKPVFTWEVDGAEGKRITESAIRLYEGETLLLDTNWLSDIDRLGYEADVTLKSRTVYTWTVRVRSDAGEEAESGPNRFETGKHGEKWRAAWISCAEKERLPIFHKKIVVKPGLKRARMYICGLGLYEARINGIKAGEEYLTPFCNNYKAWQQVVTHDVGEMLTQGENLLSVTLADGWYAGRFGFTSRPGHRGYYGIDKRLLCEVWLSYEDGSEECIPSDDSWYVTRSTYTFSDIYDGERRDDTLSETVPEKVLVLEDTTDTARDRLSPAVRAQKLLKPIALLHTPAGETVLDIGQNQTGIFRLKIDEPRGTKIHIQVGEVLQKGCFYRENLRTAKAEYVYVSGGEPVVLEPKFTFYGYRYVKIEGIHDLKKDDFTAVVLHSDMDKTGTLETANAKVNRLILNAHWGILSNMLDVPTDCPQRDERMGWTGDAQVISATACRFRDTYSFYRKFLYDMWTEQQALDGQVPDVVPAFGIRSFSCVWGDACTVIPWNVYMMSGDKSILKKQYASMKAWVDWIEKLDGKDHKWRKVFHYGDWVALDFPLLKEDTCLGGTDEGFIADTARAESALTVAKAAEVLGYGEDAEKYRAIHKRIIDDVKKEFFTVNGRSAIETQTGLLLSLKYDLSPSRERILAQLDKRFTQTHGRLQTGFVGTPILNNMLSENGRHAQAVDLLLNEDYPGWLYAVNLGATTIWERWNSMNPDGSVSSTGMNSFNHYAYGSVVEWMFKHLAGLSARTPGYRSAFIRPMPDLRLGKIDMHYKGWHVFWEAKDINHLHLRVSVPFDCTAYLTLPFGSKADRSNPIFARMDGEECVLESGEYEIEYETDAPLKKRYTLDNTMDELLTSLDGRLALRKSYPRIDRVSSIWRKRSMRDILKLRDGDEALIPVIEKTLEEI